MTTKTIDADDRIGGWKGWCIDRRGLVCGWVVGFVMAVVYVVGGQL